MVTLSTWAGCSSTISLGTPNQKRWAFEAAYVYTGNGTLSSGTPWNTRAFKRACRPKNTSEKCDIPWNTTTTTKKATTKRTYILQIFSKLLHITNIISIYLMCTFFNLSIWRFIAQFSLSTIKFICRVRSEHNRESTASKTEFRTRLLHGSYEND